MPRNTRRNHQPAPSAPPERIMNQTTSSSQHRLSADTQDWDPPPKYEVAIAADHHKIGDKTAKRSSTEWSAQRLPSPTSQRLRNRCSSSVANDSSSRSSQHNQSHHRSSARDDAQRHCRSRQTGSLQDTSENNRCRADTRSASPSGGLDGQDRSASSSSPERKRGAGYKIKKGLEGIAYGIIQILD